MDENKQNQAPLNKDFKVPRLRFNDFSGSYVSTSLKSISKIIGGGTPNTAVKEYWDGRINWFTPTEIGKNKYVSESIRKLTDLGFKNSSAKMLEPYSILMTSRASIGLVSINTTLCCTNQGFQSITPINILPDYLYYLILTNKFQHELIRRSTKSTFLEISHNEVSKIIISLPSNKSEQNKVASLMNKIDEKIDVLVNKISTLKKYKSGLIQKELKSLCLSKKAIPLFDLLTPYKVKNTNNLPQYTVGKDGLKLIDEINYDTSNHNVFVNHCFLVGLGIEEIALSKLENGCVSPVYNVFKLKNEDDYLFLDIFIKPILWTKKHYITRKSVRREFEIDMKELQKVRIPYASDNSTISLCLAISKLDKLVETLEEKLFILSKQKSYLLDNMFI